jgi:uncharacterized protein YbjT (DUF2867 family)
MTTAIIGGTGMLGRALTAELRSRGEAVRVLSRHSSEYRVDLTTGEGLEAALSGCAAVVDASNDSNPKKARTPLVDGTRRLGTAAQAAGIGHHLAVSIIGCSALPVGYYRVKCEQERLVSEGPVPWTIVRATQFHAFAAQALAAATKTGIVPLLDVPLQTVAASDVARVIADVLEAGPRRGVVAVAGPAVVNARTLAHTWRRERRSRAVPLRLPVPGRIGRALRGGALTAAAEDSPDVRFGSVTFDEWIRAQCGGRGTDPATADV